jgi:hypothetical protein
VTVAAARLEMCLQQWQLSGDHPAVNVVTAYMDQLKAGPSTGNRRILALDDHLIH